MSNERCPVCDLPMDHEWDRAWMVRYRDGDTEPCAVVYAPSWRAAMAEGVARLNEFGAEWDDCTCERAPQWDTAWPHGPTLAARLADGWYWECGNCGCVVREDGCARHGADAGAVVVDEGREAVYCNAACRDEAAARQAEYAEARARGAVEETVIADRPPTDGREWDCQCARCGSSTVGVDCGWCGGGGRVEGDACQRCTECGGRGGWQACGSDAAWCEGHPLPGREATARGEVEWFVVRGEGDRG